MVLPKRLNGRRVVKVKPAQPLDLNNVTVNHYNGSPSGVRQHDRVIEIEEPNRTPNKRTHFDDEETTPAAKRECLGALEVNNEDEASSCMYLNAFVSNDQLQDLPCIEAMEVKSPPPPKRKVVIAVPTFN